MKGFKFVYFLLFLTISGCKTKYATKEFKTSQIPKALNYNDLDGWAAHPDKNDSIIDIFYNIKKKDLKADVSSYTPLFLPVKKMMLGILMFWTQYKITLLKILQ